MIPASKQGGCIQIVLTSCFLATRAALESRGDTIGGNDLWIAAHAKTAGFVLVTNNEREFRRVSDLKVQNWTARVS